MVKNKIAGHAGAKKRPGRPRKLNPELAERFLTAYACSPASIRTISRKLGISDGTLYRYLRRDVDLFRSYRIASAMHMEIIAEKLLDVTDPCLDSMKTLQETYRVLSLLTARARAREKKPVIFHFLRDELWNAVAR